MSAVIALENSLPEGLWIPKWAVYYENNQPYVNKMHDQNPTKQKIVLGDNANQDVLVLSGLQAGDKIVVNG
jgi:hypothetical protein